MDDQIQTGPGQSMPDHSPNARKAKALLLRAAAQLRKAKGYIPTDASYDKDAGTLATLVREIQRFLG